MPQTQLPVFPASSCAITPELAFEQREGVVVYFNGHLPVFAHPAADLAAFRLFSSQLIANGAASPVPIARARARFAGHVLEPAASTPEAAAHHEARKGAQLEPIEVQQARFKALKTQRHGQPRHVTLKDLPPPNNAWRNGGPDGNSSSPPSNSSPTGPKAPRYPSCAKK